MSILKDSKEMMLYLKTHLLIFLIILTGSFVALSFIIPNGDINCLNGACGLHIGEWHFHDAMWHIALAEIAFKTFPFINPIYSGALLHGYNFLLDIIIFAISKTGISAFFIFFKLLPITTSLLFAYFSLYYALKESKKPLFVGSLLFFLYFGASMTYILTFYHHGDIDSSVLRGFPVVSSIQPGTVFLNIQFALTLPIFLYMLSFFKKKVSLKQAVIFGVLLFICTGLKFYGGVLMLLMLYLYEFLTLLQEKKPLPFFIKSSIYTLFLITSVIFFYDPFYHSNISVPLFSFSPFAMIHTLIETPKLFYNEKLVLARYYLYARKFSPRLLAIETYTYLLFLVINYGSRLLSLIYILKKAVTRKLTKEEIVLLFAVIIATLIPTLFVQKGVWFNTMQFLYYGVFFMNFFAAKFLFELLQSRRVTVLVLAVIMIALTIPNSIEQLRFAYLPQKIVPTDDIKALQFLKNSKPGAVFSIPVAEGTAYIAALSAHPMYLASTQILDNTGVDFKERLAKLKNASDVNIEKLQVKYFYLHKKDPDFYVYTIKIQSSLHFKKIYENADIVIYSRI